MLAFAPERGPSGPRGRGVPQERPRALRRVAAGDPLCRSRGSWTGQGDAQRTHRLWSRPCGSDTTVEVWFGAQLGDVGQAVPAQRESDGQISEDLARIVHRQRLASPRQLRRQGPSQARRPDSLDPADRQLTVRWNVGAVDMDAQMEPDMLHLDGISSLRARM